MKKLKALGKLTDTEVRLEKRRGKGSHGTLYYGNRKTTIKDLKKEIGIGLFRAMCSQLGIDQSDL